MAANMNADKLKLLAKDLTSTSGREIVSQSGA
jgi:hypothetical protein